VVGRPPLLLSFLNPFPGGGAHLASGAERPALLRCGRYSTGTNESSDVGYLGFNPLSLGFESLEGSREDFRGKGSVWHIEQSLMAL
jgi:hypothetical protein